MNKTWRNVVNIYTYPLEWATLTPEYVPVRCPDCGKVFRALLGEETTCKNCGRVFIPLEPAKFPRKRGRKYCVICGKPISGTARRKYCTRCANLKRYNQKLRLQRRRSHNWLMDIVIDYDDLRRGVWRPYIRERKLLLTLSKDVKNK